MKFAEVKHQLTRYLSAMPSKVFAVHGAMLPRIKKCDNFIQLAGKSVLLYSTPKHIPYDQNPQYWNARNELHDLYYHEIEAEIHRIYNEYAHLPKDEFNQLLQSRSEELYNRYYGRLVKAYVALLKAEAQLGCVRVPVTYHRYRENTKVSSHYGKWDINYSPVLSTVPTPSTDVFKSTAQLFAKTLLNQEHYSTITVQLTAPVHEQDYVKTHMLMQQFCNDYNLYLAEEFEEKKDDIHYRHRDDRDPGDW